MAGGVTGVSAGNRTSYDPSPTGLSGREDAMAAYHKNPPPAEDYSVLSGRANVSKEEAETCTS